MSAITGRQALIPRWLGVGVIALIAAVSLASIGFLLTDIGAGLLTQGPAAIDPHIGEELAILFHPSLISSSQRFLHVFGIAVFLGLATLLISKRGASDRAPLAAITLACLGASLFAPLSQLPGGEVISTAVGSLTPEGLAAFWGSLAGISTVAFLSSFPDGTLTPSWTKWLVGACLAVGVITLAFPETPMSPTTWPEWLQGAWVIGVPTLAIWAQVVRRRRSPMSPAARPVAVWLIAALAAFLMLWILQPELSPGVLDLVVVTPRLRAVYALNILILLTVAVFMFPVSVSVAIVRHRLFDLDLIVNRALVYGGVTAMVGLLFVGLTLAVARIANEPVTEALSGWRSGPAGVALGICLVAVVNPLRKRVQRGVDRRFYRERYDARQVIDRFAGEAAKLVDPATLETRLVATVDQALRPVSVVLHTGPFSSATREALGGGTTVDLASVRPGAGLAPFQKNGSAVLVPLVAGGSLTGVLDLGRRSSESRYSALDLDLLDRLGQAAGPALQLSYEVKAREREARVRERESHELELAKKIQQGLLPHEYPDVAGWEFDAFYRPAREIGGDFYDWIPLSDGCLAVVIGDVSDKGIPAALVMATCRTLLRVSASTGRAPGDVLAEVNERIQADIPPGMFITCLLTIIDPSNGTMVMANAGHNLPYRRNREAVSEIMVRGMPLGLMAGMDYEVVSGELLPGESLILSSDGLAESHSPQGEMYGTERLRDAIARANGNLLANTLESHDGFVGDDWEQEDDITLVTVTRAR